MLAITVVQRVRSREGGPALPLTKSDPSDWHEFPAIGRFLRGGVRHVQTHEAQGTWLADHHAIKTEQPTVTEEQIRRRAYELYLARGQKPGDPVQDWMQAEEDLRMRLVHH